MRNFGEFFDNQVQYAGAIIMSRTDIVDEKKAMESMELLRSINEKELLLPLRLRSWMERKSWRLWSIRYLWRMSC